MALRQTIVVDIGEISAVEIRCNQCQGVICFPLSGKILSGICCPGCSQELLAPNSQAAFAVQGFLNSLQNWRAAAPEACSATFSIDFPPGPAAKQQPPSAK